MDTKFEPTQNTLSEMNRIDPNEYLYARGCARLYNISVKLSWTYCECQQLLGENTRCTHFTRQGIPKPYDNGKKDSNNL